MAPLKDQPSVPGSSHDIDQNKDADAYPGGPLFGSDDENNFEYQDDPNGNYLIDLDNLDPALFVDDTEPNQPASNEQAANESDLPTDDDEDIQPATKKRKVSSRGKSQATTPNASKEAGSKATGHKPGKGAIKTDDNWRHQDGYEPKNPPLASVDGWFKNLTAAGHALGLHEVVRHLEGRPLRVATMCSGTESPILALTQVCENLSFQFNLNLEFEHVFSAEIVPYKQAFIERNFRPPIIFRDITELSMPMEDGCVSRTATTAYGGKADVPGDIDFLIAGFVCSDYSLLNNLPKKIEDRGESGDTFFAIKDYCEQYRPKFVGLENVISVPWTDEKAKKRKSGTGKERGLDSHFEEIGYATHHVILDTKDYYVPQTRMRGYLIAVDRNSFRGTDAELSSMLDEWERQVKKDLKHKASVPAEYLLLESDDPKLKCTQGDDPDQKKKSTEWDRCRSGHEVYRSKIQLGPNRPITSWSPGGFKQLLDYTTPFRGATERVLDTLDISHLRGISRGYDDRYFNRLPELSQNSYRITDTTLSGLNPCITPTGFPWSTTRGGGTTGFESLLFQALNADSLDTTNLTQVELRNLAGNAMTSTVIGAVIIAALNTFHKILDPGPGPREKKPRYLPDLAGSQTANAILEVAKYGPLSVIEAQKLASHSCRLCYCEGRTELAAGPFLQCTICRHIGCAKCSKKPKHGYKRYPAPYRITPFQLEEQLKMHIPMAFRITIGGSLEASHFLHTMRENRPQHMDETIWLSTIEATKKALCSDVYYREIIRRESLHVHFSSQFVEGSGARLELVMSSRRIEWLLYATVPSTEPLGSKRRQFLEKFPLARLRPEGSDISKGTWMFDIHKEKQVHAVIKAKGDLVDSYKVKVGLEDLAENTRIWNKFSLEFTSKDDIDSFEVDISGDYEHAAECGQAYDSLHVRVASNGDPHPTFMFFDHEKTLRNPLLDSFVFTDDPRRLEYRQYRPTFGRLDPKFHPSGSTLRTVDVTKSSEGTNSTDEASVNPTSVIAGAVKPKGEDVVKQEGEDLVTPEDEDDQDEDGSSSSDEENTPDLAEGATIQTNDAPTPAAAKKSGFHKPSVLGEATAGLTVLLHEAVTERDVVIYTDSQWIPCPELSLTPLRTCDVQYRHLKVNDPGERPLPCNSQRAVFWCKAQKAGCFSNRWVRGVWTELSKCSKEPFFKEFRWLLEKCRIISDHKTHNAMWQAALAPDDKCSSCAPKYPTLLWTYTDGSKQAPFEDPNDACIYEHSIKARPQPLSVRYNIGNDGSAQIQVGMDSTTLIHRALGQLALTGSTENIKVAWRLITDDNPLAKPVFDPLLLWNSELEPPAYQPPRVTNHALRTEQLKNLTWAINQERNPQPFTEEFVVEDRVAHIKYRAEGKATRQVVVPSGVLAHEVGFGKTLMMLSLVDSQSDWDQHYASYEIPGRIATTATLVCCPPHLASQWQSEAQKFLPGMKKKDILCINTFQKLKGLAVEQFLTAKLIIVNWNLLEGESYTLAQAQLAGMVEPDTKTSDRAFRSWYIRALQNIGQNVEELKARPATFAIHINDQFTQDKSITQSTHAVIPSKRLTGSAYKNKSSIPASDATSRKQKQPSKAPSLKERADIFNLANIQQDYTKTKCPLLELFSFARVVIDEYTYLADGMKQAYTVLELIGARHKWLLSGTPALSGFSDIKQIAKLIGVSLGVDDYTLMKSDVLSRERKAMTRSEEFLMYRDAPSPAWQERRHRHAQAFLNHFVRKDIAKFDPILTNEWFHLIDQPAAVKAAYHELMQFLTDTRFDLAKRVRSHHHKSKLIHDALFQCQDAAEVLLLRAASSPCDLVEGAEVGLDELCDKVIEIRTGDYLQTKAQLEDGYKLARWIDTTGEYSAGFFETFQKSVKEDKLGDSETAKDVETLLLEIEKGPPVEPSELPDSEDTPTLRQLSISLRTLFTKLIDIQRSLRFAQGVRDIYLSQSGEAILKCSKCGIQGSLRNYVLLSQCGHLVCNSCLPVDYEHCQAPKCLAGNSHYNKVSADYLVSGQVAGVPVTSGKLDEMVNLIKNQIPRDDKVLVFVQFPKLFKAVEGALREHNIDFCDLHAAIGSWKVLSQFQKAGSGSKRVMILNIGDASASGSNLAMANHVIFVSPYHTKGSNAQYTYDAAMTQAIGRARRFGQQKTVSVYHFMVKFTADIDIMEFRTSGTVLSSGLRGQALSLTGNRDESQFGTAFYNHISSDFD